MTPRTLGRGRDGQELTANPSPRNSTRVHEPPRLTPGNLAHLLATVISDVERLESRIALQRGMIGRTSAADDPRRLERETEKFGLDIEATTASLREALSELRRLEGEAVVRRGAPSQRPRS